MPFPTFAAGAPFTAANARALQRQEVNQGSDQTVTSSTTFVNSSIIIPNVEISARYWYLVLGAYKADTAADIKINWTVPTGGSMQRWALGVGLSSTGNAQDATNLNTRFATTATSVTLGGTGTGTETVFQEEGIITGGSVAGSFTMQFAQVTSNPIGTVLTANTTCFYQRIG